MVPVANVTKTTVPRGMDSNTGCPASAMLIGATGEGLSLLPPPCAVAAG